MPWCAWNDCVICVKVRRWLTVRMLFILRGKTHSHIHTKKRYWTICYEQKQHIGSNLCAGPPVDKSRVGAFIERWNKNQAIFHKSNTFFLFLSASIAETSTWKALNIFVENHEFNYKALLGPKFALSTKICQVTVTFTMTAAKVLLHITCSHLSF